MAVRLLRLPVGQLVGGSAGETVGGTVNALPGHTSSHTAPDHERPAAATSTAQPPSYVPMITVTPALAGAPPGISTDLAAAPGQYRDG